MSLPPLVIDLDGTLVRTDIMIETALRFLRTSPLKMLRVLISSGFSRARFKGAIAQNVDIDPAALPYNPDVLALVKTAAAAGVPIVLATGAHISYAQKIADYLGFFSRVMATDGDVNLSGTQKRDALVAAYGANGFDYAGNAHDDVPVWQAAHKAYVVNPDPGVAARVKDLPNVAATMKQPVSAMTWVKGIRLHQWVKNLLVLVPLFANHQIGDPVLLAKSLLAFVLFGLCASCVYILNDLLDLDDDRHHPTKKNRPLASGMLPVKTAAMLVPGVLAVTLMLALIIFPWKFGATLAVYFVLTCAYSVYFKTVMMIDVIALALFYTLRVLAGSYALDIALTFWLLAFALFVFLSLAFVKRAAELHPSRMQVKKEMIRGRGYCADDFYIISAMGVAAGFISVMILAFYIQEPSTVMLYNSPRVIWFACPLLLFWIGRVWLLTQRGQMHDDPIVFALRDIPSLVTGALFAGVFWLAL